MGTTTVETQLKLAPLEVSPARVMKGGEDVDLVGRWGDKGYVLAGTLWAVLPDGRTQGVPDTTPTAAESKPVNRDVYAKPCRYYESCAAPLCPLDKSVASAVWYPAEAICHRTQDKPNWVRKQLKIAKRVTDSTLFFTVETLTVIRNVRKPKGTDPDKKPPWKSTRAGVTAKTLPLMAMGKTANKQN